MSQLFQGIEGGKDKEAHDRRLETVTNIVETSRLRSNKDKCLFRQFISARSTQRHPSSERPTEGRHGLVMRTCPGRSICQDEDVGVNDTNPGILRRNEVHLYFTSFTEQYGFTLVTSSPCLPNTNGEAEQALQTAKRILIQDDPWLGPRGSQGHCDCGHGMQSCSTGDGSTYPYDPANSIIGTVT
ncbi:hypothetical protein LSAT2_030058 [Lamellibrachia satsuma]|nr:hypothetical protein LSAT2_030058 [Lamellibrachia satsuma]